MHSPHSIGDPIVFFLSITIVFKPLFAAQYAAPEPPGPHPTTNTSHFTVGLCFPMISNIV